MPENNIEKQREDTNRRADEMISAIGPCAQGGGFVMPTGAEKDRFFDSAKDNDAIARLGLPVIGAGNDEIDLNVPVLSGIAQATKHYFDSHGQLPSTSALAGINRTMEQTGAYFDSAIERGDITHQEGQKLKAKALTLIPFSIMSSNAAMDLSHQVPFGADGGGHRGAGNSFVEMELIEPVAASDFGGFKKGETIGLGDARQFSIMSRQALVGVGDDAKKTFQFKTEDALGKKTAIKQLHSKVLLQRKEVAEEDKKGNFQGQDADGQAVQATVDHENGTINITFTAAPKTGQEVHVKFAIDTEHKDFEVPKIKAKVSSVQFRDKENIIGAEQTLQGNFLTMDAYGVNGGSMALMQASAQIAAEKDREAFDSMYFHSQNALNPTEINVNIGRGISNSEEYSAIQEQLRVISGEMMEDNRRAGITAIVAGPKLSKLLQSTGDNFKRAPNYKEVPIIHYVGTVFGWKLFEDPQMHTMKVIDGVESKEFDGSLGLCAALGDSLEECPYFMGDTLGAVKLLHDKALTVKEAGIYSRAISEMNPLGGEKYLRTIKVNVINNTP